MTGWSCRSWSSRCTHGRRTPLKTKPAKERLTVVLDDGENEGLEVVAVGGAVPGADAESGLCDSVNLRVHALCRAYDEDQDTACRVERVLGLLRAVHCGHEHGANPLPC